MNYPTIELFNWIKRLNGDCIDLFSSGISGPSTLSELGLDSADVHIGGNNFYGYQPSLDAMADFFGTTPSSIVACPGASMANFLAMGAILKPNDVSAVELPVYQPLLCVARHFTLNNPFRITRDSSQRYDLPKDFGELELRKPILTVMTNPHNPTGRLIPLADILKLAETVNEWNGYLLVDEVFLPFVENYHEFTSAGKHPGIITTGSLTKAWGLGGLRFGWVIGEPVLMRHIELSMDYMHVNQPFFSDNIVAQILSSSKSEELLTHARTRSAANLSIVDSFVTNEMHLDWFKPDCAISAIINFVDGRQTDSFCKTLHEKFNTVVVPGKYFDMPNAFRLSFGIDELQLRNGLTYIKHALAEL